MAPSFRLATLAVLAVLVLALPCAARASGKAYAPEDLRRLAVPDRVRVLDREYAELSGGGRLPDDQLEFYLDQIDAGWTFSEIRRDMAESLRAGHWRPAAPGWQAREVICSSIDHRPAECRTPFRGPAVLSEQLSAADCIEGRTWGQRRGLIWVDRGCRGRFREGRWAGSPDWQAPPRSVVCESREGKRRRCPLPFAGPVRLAEQLSNADCIEGRTWSQSPGEVWVTRGCRAVFVEIMGRGRGADFGLPGSAADRPAVTCASEDERRRSCAWNPRLGPPYLLEQLSRAPCVEGRSWGWEGDRIWVDRGCRGRFAAR